MLNKDFIMQFADIISEGVIYIDSKGIVKVYNDKAKSIFGITNDFDYSHDGGIIKKGDIVIIGDNFIGKDDGGLLNGDFQKIGVIDSKIKKDGAIVCIGEYGINCGGHSSFKYKQPNERMDILFIEKRISQCNISCEINFIEKYIKIKVNKKEFKLYYLYALGHMVILDPITFEIKFYQNPGYTARNESIKQILDKKEFLRKTKGYDSMCVIGKSIYDIHESTLIDEFYKVAKGEKNIISTKTIDINGILTRCSIYPIDSDSKRIGAALKVEDISLIKKIMAQRDEAIENLENMQRMLNNKMQMENNLSTIVGDSEEIKRVKEMALKGSKTNSTIILLGESGTGKSLIARSIHENSGRKDKPFVHVNCASIPENLIESELFGYVEGAFTGAKKQGKKGYIQLASNGTLFLDEIGELSISMQSKLLKVLQERTYFKLGADDELKVTARIICATNKDLEKEIKNNNFREDLFYRINVFPIYIPPLRERKEDIYQLVKAMIPNICKKMEIGIKKISYKSLYELTQYDWPGNIRELENVLERAINMTEGTIINENNIYIKKGNTLLKENFKLNKLKYHLNETEKNVILKTLRSCDGDKKQAMNVLGIKKTSFYDKLKKYSI